MGKLDEALRNAQALKQAKSESDPILAEPPEASNEPTAALNIPDAAVNEPTPVSKEESIVRGDDFREEMLGLYNTIDARLPGRQSRIILFVGTQEGEGTSTMVREFCSLCSNELGHSVLLLDADTHRKTQERPYDIPDGYGWIEALVDGKEIESAIHQIENSTLFVSPPPCTGGPAPGVFNSPGFVHFCERLKARFDFALVDSAPFSMSPNLLDICPKVDGVVLIVEASKTRWRKVRQLSETITKVGGNVLGIVLNKRKYYIPGVIYNLL